MKKFLTYSVVVATIAWSLGISAVLPAAAAYSPVDGDLIKTATYPAVYYVAGGKKYLFVNRVTFGTWKDNFNGLKVISQTDFDALSLGGNVTARPGVSLIKFDNSDLVYAVTPGATLVKVDAATKTALYGSAAPIVIQSSFESNYTKSAATLTATSNYPDGSLVSNGGTTYLVMNGALQAVSGDAFTANAFKTSYVHAVSSISGYTVGSALTGKVSAVSDIVAGAGSATSVSAGTLGVSLASVSPATATLVSDTVNTSQALVPMIAVNLTASSAGAVKVTGMTFERTGISNDSDVTTSYLFDGTTKLADGGSISSKVLTFNASNGIITVPAGQTKTVWLKIDTTINTSAGKSIGFNLTGITSNAASVSGTPISGNLMNTANVTDMGYAVISSGNVPTAAATVNSNETDFEVYKVTLTATDQDMQLEGLRLTEIGSISKDDLQNIKLNYGGTTLATASFNDSMELYFDLSNAPFQIAKGNSKTLSVKADILKGSTRTFKFSIQNASDILVKDKGYNVYTQAFKSSAVTWSAVTSADSTYVYTINSGTLSLAKDTTSPSGTVPSNATNVKVATYKITATGEDIKVKSMNLNVNTTFGSGYAGVQNAKIYYDGVQVGSTKNLTAENTDVNFTFGSSFIVPAGASKLVDIYADMKTATGTAITSGTVTMTLSSSDAQGVISLTALTLAEQDSNALSIGTVSAITLAKYSAYGSQSLTSPASQAKIGSFTIGASATEGVNVENLYIKGATSGQVSNMNIKVGSSVIASKATFSATNVTTTISVNGKLNLAKSETKVVDIYADLASGITGATVTLSVNADGTTPDTNTTATGNATAVLQDILTAAGSLTVDANGSKPDSAIIVAGATTAVSAFTMMAANDSYTVTNLTVTSSISASDRSVGAVILEYKNEAGETKTASGYLVSGEVAFSGLSIWIPQGVGATVSIKALVADATGAKSGDIVRLNLKPAASGTNAALFSAVSKSTGSVSYTYTGSTGVTGNTMIVRKTKPLVNLVSLPTTVLADGTQTLAKFSIAADAAGDVTWRKMGFIYSTSADAVGVTAGTIYLYKDGDSTKLNASGLSLGGASKAISFVADNEQTITKGTSQTYVLKGDITGSAANTSFTTKISGTSATAGTSNTYAGLGTETMFWWSDRSGLDDDGVHTATSNDWCDSNYVRTLPSDSQTLSR